MFREFSRGSAKGKPLLMGVALIVFLLCINGLNVANSYASREAVDLLNLEYHFMPHDTVARLRGGHQAGVKRWLKEEIYARLPGGFRAFAYFFYRYVIRLGFLDGQAGTAFHFLQGFWYRYLVDAKVAEVKRAMREMNLDVAAAIERVLEIRVRREGGA